MGVQEDYARVSTFWRRGNLGRKLGVALIGGAAEDSFFVRNVWVPALSALRRQVRIVGINDIDTEAAIQFREDFGVEKVYGSVDEIIGDESVDIAVVGTPTAFHAEAAIPLARAGKAMICEKPMTHTAESALELVTALYDGRNNGIGTRCAISYTQSHAPMALLAGHISRLPGEHSGYELGAICSFAITYLQAWMRQKRKPGEPGYRQEMARTDPEQTGSSNVTADLSTHGLDFLDVVAQGNEVKYIDAKLGSTTGREIDDSSIVRVELTSGATGSITSNNAWQARSNELKADASFTHGSLYFEAERSDRLRVQLPGLPEMVYSNGAQDTIITNSGRVEMPAIIGDSTFLPPGHEGSAYDYKARLAALALAEAVACDLMQLDPTCLQRPYRTAMSGLRGSQFVQMCVENDGKGRVENPFLAVNKGLPADTQRIGLYKPAK